MATDVEWLEEHSLRDPVAILAFEGWNDASDAASGVLYYLMENHEVAPLARLDLENYVNYQESRPLVTLEGRVRNIRWPTVGFFGLAMRGHSHDLVLVLGEEPHLRWRRFSLEVASALRELGVRQAVALGAFVGEIAHTLPVPVFGSSSDPNFANRFGLHASAYEGRPASPGSSPRYSRTRASRRRASGPAYPTIWPQTPARPGLGHSCTRSAT